MAWHVRDPRTQSDVSEGERQAEILITIGALPDAHFWRNNTGAYHDGKRLIRYGAPGSADILGCYQGRFVGIEVKGARGRMSADQKTWAVAVRAAGGVYILACTPAKALEELRKLES